MSLVPAAWLSPNCSQGKEKDGSEPPSSTLRGKLRISERDFSAELTAARGNRDAVVLGSLVDLPEIGAPKVLARNTEARVV